MLNTSQPLVATCWTTRAIQGKYKEGSFFFLFDIALSFIALVSGDVNKGISGGVMF